MSLLRVARAVACVASCRYAERANVRVYDDSMYRSHLCAHGRALTQSCRDCRDEVIARILARFEEPPEPPASP